MTGPNTPEHCGENGGQHMYLDAGAYTDNSAALNMVLSGNTARKWRIKVIIIMYYYRSEYCDH